MSDQAPLDAPPAPAAVRTVSRARAAALHAAFGLLGLGALAFASTRWWFPDGLFAIDGDPRPLALAAAALALGPASTFLIHRPGRRRRALVAGLGVALHAALLGHGLAAAHAARPVAVVFADGAFGTLSAAAHARAAERLRALDAEPRAIDGLAAGPGPAFLATPEPATGELAGHLRALFDGWPEPHERSDRYVAAAAAAGELAAAALWLDGLRDPAVRAAVRRAIEAAGADPARVQLHRFRARRARGIAVYDPDASRVVEWVAADRA